MYKLMAQNAASWYGGGAYLLAYHKDKEELKRLETLRKERDKKEHINYMVYWIEKGKVDTDVYTN